MSIASWSWEGSAGIAVAFVLVIGLVLSFGGNLFLAQRLAACQRDMRRREDEREAEAFERVIAQERTRIARDIHDDLGAGLTQIALLTDIAGSGKAPCEEVMEGLKEIRARAQESLLALNEIVWAVDPGCDNLPRLADYLWSLADGCFRNSGVRCRKDVPIDLPDRPVRADVRHQIAMAVKEAMANALRHAGASEVCLALRWEEPVLRIEVEDDGRGFDPAAEGAGGRGIENQRQRMLQAGGTVRIARRPNRGTRVTFSMPLNAMPPGGPIA